MARISSRLAPLGVLAVAATVALGGCASSTPGVPGVAGTAVTSSTTSAMSSSRSADPTTTVASTTTDDAACSGTISFVNGSLPPPYHYEWRVVFGPSDATMTVRGGYDDSAPSWKQSFTPTVEQVAGLCEAATDLIENSEPDDEPLPGGTAGAAEVKGHQPGRVVLGSRASSSLDVTVKPFVPTGIWTELMGKYEAWVKTQK